MPDLLFVDDNQDDVCIACWQLSKAGITVRSTVVGSEPDLRDELMWRIPDMIVSDFTMPGFDGWGALRIAQVLRPEVPFVFHSGSIGEERSRIALIRGAYGCISKDHATEFTEMVKRALESLPYDAGYIATLVELAKETPIGKTWLLERSKLIADLGIKSSAFEGTQLKIEARMPGKWGKAVSSAGDLYIYKRLE